MEENLSVHLHCGSFYFCRIIRSAKNTPGPLISNHQLAEGEIILDVDGTVPIQPVLQHIGISAWPGELPSAEQDIKGSDQPRHLC
jgi:hypothetical protein